jgi:hypothetical protein
VRVSPSPHINGITRTSNHYSSIDGLKGMFLCSKI